MSDDGVGVHAAQALAQDPPPGTTVVDAGTDALSALAFLEGASHVLLIDAVQGGGEPGTVRRLTESELSPRQGLNSAHAVSLLASRHLFPPDADWPEFAILGVEPATMTYGMELSPAVSSAMPGIKRLCHEIVTGWRMETVPT
jgi:hydrogenase maturation protease